MIRKMIGMAIGDLCLEEWMLRLIPYPLTYEVGMIIICVTLRLSLQKGRYVGNLQWDIMRKAPTEWKKIYGAGTLGMGDTVFLREGNIFTETA